MAVTVKCKDLSSRFQNNQTGTVLLSAEDIAKIVKYEEARDEFLKWLGRDYTIYGQGRTKEYNTSKGGNSASNHLKCLASDIYIKVDFDEERVKKYMRKWKAISEKYGFVGEFGFYPEYQYKTYKGMCHIGGFVTYSKTFTNWKTIGNKQYTNYYKL